MRFEFATAGRILVGLGRAADLPSILAGLGSRLLVCTGGNPERHAGLLADLGGSAAVFPVAAEPTVELARAAVAAAREHGADVIAAIGGGSVIDTGKAVAMLLATAATRWTTWRWSGPAGPSPVPPSRASRCPPPRAPGRR